LDEDKGGALDSDFSSTRYLVRAEPQGEAGEPAAYENMQRAGSADCAFASEGKGWTYETRDPEELVLEDNFQHLL